MTNKVITINGTFSPRKVNESLTEEEFADIFFDFLDKNDLIFGGGWTEEDDEEQQEGAAKRRPTVAGAKRRHIMRLVDPKNWLIAFINKNKPIFGLLEGDKNSL